MLEITLFFFSLNFGLSLLLLCASYRREKGCCLLANSLRSSRFRFLQAKRGKRARALGKKEQKSRSGGSGGEGKETPAAEARRFLSFPAPPPALTFLLLFAQCPRALASLGLKETETTATQASHSRGEESSAHDNADEN